MTLDERDLARLTGGDLDLDDLPLAPMDADPGEDEERVPVRRRTSTWNRPPARVLTLRERAAALQAGRAERPLGVAPEPVQQPANNLDASDDNSTDSGKNIPEIIPAPPAEETNVVTEKRITQSEAAAIFGLTLDAVAKMRLAGKLVSGRLEPTPPGMTGGHGKVWMYDDAEVRELARQRQKPKAPKSAPQRDTKPEKVQEKPQKPRQAPARAAQPKKPAPAAKPRPAPPSPPATPKTARDAYVPVRPSDPQPEITVRYIGEPLSPSMVLGQLGQLADAGIISRAKLDRVLAVLLEG